MEKAIVIDGIVYTIYHEVRNCYVSIPFSLLTKLNEILLKLVAIIMKNRHVDWYKSYKFNIFISFYTNDRRIHEKKRINSELKKNFFSKHSGCLK